MERHRPVRDDAQFDPRRFGRRMLVALAVLGLIGGIYITIYHLQQDPLADVRAYYDAGARLNAGQPLYPPDADTNVADFYRYPPLVAIAFRPLALLPYDVVAPLWGLAMLAAFALTIRRLGLGSNTLIAAGLLAWPIGWSLAIGQAQVLITLLTVLGTPWAIALASNIKLFPALIGIYWLGRRDFRKVAALIAWGLGLLAVQFILEPTGTRFYLGFPNLEQVGQVNNLSPYGISPILWAVLVVAGGLTALRLAPTRWGWPAAVTLSVLATPRLLSYQLMALLPAIQSPDRRPASVIDRRAAAAMPLPAAPASGADTGNAR
jgi:hypothetical protein